MHHQRTVSPRCHSPQPACLSCMTVWMSAKWHPSPNLQVFTIPSTSRQQVRSDSTTARPNMPACSQRLTSTTLTSSRVVLLDGKLVTARPGVAACSLVRDINKHPLTGNTASRQLLDIRSEDSCMMVFDPIKDALDSAKHS